MNPLFKKAIIKADDIRAELKLDMYEPLNIIDACTSLGLTVRFVDISMEGLYVTSEEGKHPTILLSNQRPLPRRFYTCAHELGHHVFNHGFKIDGLSSDRDASINDLDELLVDTFAGALLMPVAGVQEEFAKRNWDFKNATPIQFYTIASVFGIGYTTLITNCKINKLIDDYKVDNLLKSSPKQIFEKLFGSKRPNSYFKIIDELADVKVVDLEVSNYIVMSPSALVEGSHLQSLGKVPSGVAFIANKPGIVRVTNTDGTKNFFIRIQRQRYEGLAENRHLETE